MKSDALLKQLATAFPVENPPAAVVPRSEGEPYPDDAFLTAHLEGRRWTEVDDAALVEMGSDLPLLTDAAFRYYLPAFLRRTIQAPEWEPAYLLMNLTPHAPEVEREFWPKSQSRLYALTPEQRSVVRSFLEWVVSEPKLASLKDDAVEALEAWAKV